ncbi:MAG: phosphoenolpyruvate--protein phosphotransferase [bacterium]
MAGRELVLNGIPASPGVAMGTAVAVERRHFHIPVKKILQSQVESELERLDKAIEESIAELKEIRERVASEMGESYARIFDAHRMILEDSRSLENVQKMIREGFSAEYAFNSIYSGYEKELWEKGDAYVKDRAIDIRDVRMRVLSSLIGSKQFSGAIEIDSEAVIIAHDLSPAETAQMRKQKVLGFAIDVGGRTSHTAIMARSLEIPAVVGLQKVSTSVVDGDFVIVDGNRGKVVISPSPETVEKYVLEMEKYARVTNGLLRFKDLPPVTIDGHSIILSANIESHEEIESVIQHGAQGIGLYRTEFLFIGRQGLPSEDEQYEIYRVVVKAISPDPVIIRTVDIGGDKFISEMGTPAEVNPYLGWRGIRFCLARPDIFKVQLRAILRASASGNVKIMFPMVSNVEEIVQANNILEEAKEELRTSGFEFDSNCEVGIMIETPSAALIAPELARNVNFFSIGSNDLIQYTLAADRGNEKVAYLYEPLHPAVLRLIKQTIDAAKQNKIWVGLCGEMASDLVCAFVLLGLGIEELSASPYMVPAIKEMVRSVYYSDARQVADFAMSVSDPVQIRQKAISMMHKEFPDLLL